MGDFFQIDWHSMFVPTESLLEIFIRGTLMYLGMFTLLRVFRRQAGAVGIADLLVIVVIADAAQNGMAGDSKSITEAILLICTIVLWDYFLDFLGTKFDFFARILAPKKLLLIKDGKMNRHNMQKELITYEELMSQLRQQGIEDIAKVKQCHLEGNGRFSFLTEGDEDKPKGNVNAESSVH